MKTKSSEELMKQSEEKYRLLFMDNPAPMWIYDSKTLKFLEVNDFAVHHYGYTREEFLNMTLKDIRPVDEIPHLTNSLENIKGRLRKVGNVKHIKKDGTIIDVEITAHEIYYEGRKAMFVLAMDITEKKRTEIALQESEKRFRLLYENAPLSYQSLDINGNIIDVNKAWLQVMGYEFNEVIGRHFTEFMTKESAALVESRFSNFLEIGHIHNYEFEMIRKDGSHLIVSYEGNIGYDENGNFKQTHCIFKDVTEQKITEKTLRENEFQLRQSQRVARIGYYILDVRSGKWTSSEMLDEIFGIDQDYIRDVDGWNHLVHPDFQLEMVNYFTNEVIGERKSFDKEYKIINKKINKVLWVHGLGTLEFDETGNPIRMFGTIQDITERKEAAEALTESEEKYRKFFEEDLTGDFTSTLDGKLLLCNSAYAKILGFDSADEMMSVSTKTFYKNPEDRVKVIEAIREKKKLENYEITLLTKDGKEVIAIENIYGEFDSNGELVLLKGYLFDITAIRRAEEALRESEERFHSMFEKNKAVMFLINPKTGKFIDANNAASQFYGYSLTELRNMNVDQINLIPKEEIFYALSTAANGGQSYFHYPHKLKSGEIRNVEVYTSPILIKGEVVLFSIIHDITERKKAEREVIESREKLRALAARLEQVKEDEKILLARELHDNLGQRLTGLKLDTAWLQRRISDQIGDGTEAILRRIQEMSSLIDEIINNVRRISSELRPNILDYIGLLPSLEWLLEDFKKKTETDGSFESDIKEIIVDKSTSTSIFRIFQEAITNIIRHANATFVQMKIEEDNKNYVVQLLDNGVGVDEEKINDLKSLGVIGMKERALQINSVLNISNRVEGGTKVSLIIPKGNGLW